MEGADLEKAFRCVLQHDVVELASFCAAASSSRTLLRCASDAEVDTLRWRPEFRRRFPWLSSTESRTLSVARSAQIWQGEECKFSTCWRRTYLGVVQSWPRAGSQQRYDADARLGVTRRAKPVHVTLSRALVFPAAALFSNNNRRLFAQPRNLGAEPWFCLLGDCPTGRR